MCEPLLLREKARCIWKKYFVCLRQDDHKCLVSITLNDESGLIVIKFWEHCHDNDLLKPTIKQVVNQKAELVAVSGSHTVWNRSKDLGLSI